MTEPLLHQDDADGVPHDMRELRIWALRQWLKAALLGVAIGLVIGLAILIGAVVSLAF